MSTSTGPAAAMVAASGFIWSMNGQSVVRTPTVASDPVARNRKSRFVTEAPPWPSEAELIVIAARSPKPSAPDSPAQAPRVYPPLSPLATVRGSFSVGLILDFARRQDDDPPGGEIDRRRDLLGERQEQGFAAVRRRDFENVA